MTYRAAHERVRAERGPASAQRCAQCGRPAAVWCYDGADPAARTDDRGRRYSLDPARYRPRCRSCHRRAAVPRPRPTRARRRPRGRTALPRRRHRPRHRRPAAAPAPSTVIAALRDPQRPDPPRRTTTRRSDYSRRHSTTQPPQHPNHEHQTTQSPRPEPQARDTTTHEITNQQREQRTTQRPKSENQTIASRSDGGCRGP